LQSVGLRLNNFQKHISKTEVTNFDSWCASMTGCFVQTTYVEAAINLDVYGCAVFLKNDSL
jgi:hypothetical protein